MRCDCLTLILIAAFVIVPDSAKSTEQTAGHLVVEVKGGTDCASYCAEYGRCQNGSDVCCKEWGGGSRLFPHPKIDRVRSGG